MRWRGQNLISKEDFAGAMEKLSNPRDGEQFRENARVAFGDDFEQVLGYLLGDVHPNRRERVQSILKVVHPYDGYSPERMFAIGMVHGANPDSIPSWFRIVMAMPRENWSLAFEDDPTASPEESSPDQSHQ